MVEPTIVTAEPKVVTQAPEAPPVEPKKEDLVTRVSQVKVETAAPKPDEPTDTFNVNDIDNIEDPKAKEYAEKAYKSFQRGFNKKYEELAALRKDLEKKGEETSTWTSEKVQSLLKDESFVNAARSVTENPNGLTQEEYSALTDTEKAKLNNLETEVNNLRKLNHQARNKQQDEQLKRKYANYDSSIIDTTSSDLISGKVVATREDLFKVVDYDKAINRAYNLGLQDRKLETSDRLNSMSVDGINTTLSGVVPEPIKGESDKAYFKRLATKRLKEAGIKT